MRRKVQMRKVMVGRGAVEFWCGVEIVRVFE